MRARCDRKNNLIVHSNWLTRRIFCSILFSYNLHIIAYYLHIIPIQFFSLFKLRFNFFYYKFKYLKHIQWLDVTKKEYFFEEIWKKVGKNPFLFGFRCDFFRARFSKINKTAGSFYAWSLLLSLFPLQDRARPLWTWLNTSTRRKPSYKKGTSEQREHEAITLPLRLNRSRSFVITFFAGIKVGRLIGCIR